MFSEKCFKKWENKKLWTEKKNKNKNTSIKLLCELKWFDLFHGGKSFTGVIVDVLRFDMRGKVECESSVFEGFSGNVIDIRPTIGHFSSFCVLHSGSG